MLDFKTNGASIVVSPPIQFRIEWAGVRKCHRFLISGPFKLFNFPTELILESSRRQPAQNELLDEVAKHAFAGRDSEVLKNQPGSAIGLRVVQVGKSR